MLVKQISVEMKECAEELQRIKDYNAKKKYLYGKVVNGSDVNWRWLKIFNYVFNPSITFNKTPKRGSVALKIENTGESGGLLKWYLDQDKLIYFIDGHYDGLRPARLQALWLNLIESLLPEDREFILDVFEKKFPYPEITYELVWDTFHETYFNNWPKPDNINVIETKKATDINIAVTKKETIDFPRLDLPGLPKIEIPDVEINMTLPDPKDLQTKKKPIKKTTTAKTQKTKKVVGEKQTARKGKKEKVNVEKQEK